MLNKKNSQRSNSFLFLTLRKTPALHGKKKRPELLVFATLLRSFFFCNVASLVALIVICDGGFWDYRLFYLYRLGFFGFYLFLCRCEMKRLKILLWQQKYITLANRLP